MKCPFDVVAFDELSFDEVNGTDCHVLYQVTRKKSFLQTEYLCKFSTLCVNMCDFRKRNLDKALLQMEHCYFFLTV